MGVGANNRVNVKVPCLLALIGQFFNKSIICAAENSNKRRIDTHIFNIFTYNMKKRIIIVKKAFSKSLKLGNHPNFNWNISPISPDDGGCKKKYFTQLLQGVFTIRAWKIWKQRNNLIFKRSQPSFIDWKRKFYRGSNSPRK